MNPSSTNLHCKIYALIKQNPPSNPPFNKGGMGGLGGASAGISEPVHVSHPEPFSTCHSERSEESQPSAQGKFGETSRRDASSALGETQNDKSEGAVLLRGKHDSDTVVSTLFYRLGLIRTKKGHKTTTEKIRSILNDVTTFTGDDPVDVKRTIERYCVGICSDVPLCGQCALTEFCKYFKKRPSIKQLPEDERPRERLISAGEECLTDAELLGIIIRDGTQEYSAVDLARRLLTKYGDLRSLSTKTIGELCKVHGIGPAKAAQIKAAMAIARRFSTVSLKPGSQIKSSEDIFAHFHEQMRDTRQETFHVVLLDNKHRIIKDKRISTGSLSHSLVHPREVFNPAIRESAAAVVFVHNHPSGDPSPSSEDIELTRRLNEVSHVTGIKVLDHIIIGNGCYTSLKEKGLL